MARTTEPAAWLKRLRAALPLVLLVLAGIVLFSSGMLDRLHPDQLVAHRAQLHAQIASHPWLSRLAYVSLLALTMATGIPGTVVIILAGGFAFGVLQGTLCSTLGLTLGSLVLYLASRHAFRAGGRTPPAAAMKLRDGFSRHPVGYTLFLRFVPVAPFGIVTVALAWLRCPLWLFTLATLLGGTLSLFFECSIGAGLGNALAQSEHLGPGLLLHREVLLPLLAIVLLVLLAFLLRQALARRRGTGNGERGNPDSRYP